MKKYFPFISFILILSFILPFFPCFSLFTRAEDSVSSDAAYIKWEKDNVDAIRNGLASSGYVVNPDYYLISDDTLNPNVWELIARNYGITGTTVGKPLNRSIYDYCVSNNITNTDIYNNCFNDIYNEVVSYCDYFVYDFLPVSQFKTFYNFSNEFYQNYVSAYCNTLIDKVNDSGCPCIYSCNGNFFRGTGFLALMEDSLSSNYLYLYSGTFSVFPYLPYQSNVYGRSWNGSYVLDGRLKLFTNTGTTNHYNGYFIYPTYGGSWSGLTSADYYFYTGCVNNYNTGNDWANFNGSSFLVPDDYGDFSIMVFNSLLGVNNFSSGNSFVYKFSPDLDINKYGTDLDLNELYDVISDSIGDAQGNIIDTINDVANDYLYRQVRLLGDIKNALNDSFGNSWLRLIHGQLDSYFPQTIDKLDALISALSSFSGGSGGSVDLSSTNTILTDIYNRLGLMLGPYNGDDFSQNTLNHITNELAGKMPFCVVTDVVVIAALFSHEPVHPDFQFPVPFQPGETFEIDISFWEYARPFINAFFIILFIIGLIVLTQKIFSSLKG